MKRKKQKKLICNINLPSIGTNAEGKLSGGFAGIGHLSVMGIPKNNNCANAECINGPCTNTPCENSTCTNVTCVNSKC